MGGCNSFQKNIVLWTSSSKILALMFATDPTYPTTPSTYGRSSTIKFSRFRKFGLSPAIVFLESGQLSSTMFASRNKEFILSLNLTGRHDQTTTRSEQGTLCDLLLSSMAQEWIFRVHRGLISQTDGSAVFTTNNGLPP